MNPALWRVLQRNVKEAEAVAAAKEEAFDMLVLRCAFSFLSFPFLFFPFVVSPASERTTDSIPPSLDPRRSMADFPGYEPRTAEEKAYVEATYEGSACPERAPPGREWCAPVGAYRCVRERER